MTKAIHTPGPWKVDVWQNEGERFQRYSIVSETEYGAMGPTSIISGMYYDSPRDAADAALIAASPAMLKALNAAKEFLESIDAAEHEDGFKAWVEITNAVQLASAI
jgi:hypothetical protein